MNIKDLKEKPIWQMTGEEFLFLQQNSESKQVQSAAAAVPNPQKKYVYGIAGIGEGAADVDDCAIGPRSNRHHFHWDDTEFARIASSKPSIFCRVALRKVPGLEKRAWIS